MERTGTDIVKSPQLNSTGSTLLKNTLKNFRALEKICFCYNNCNPHGKSRFIYTLVLLGSTRRTGHFNSTEKKVRHFGRKSLEFAQMTVLLLFPVGLLANFYQWDVAALSFPSSKTVSMKLWIFSIVSEPTFIHLMIFFTIGWINR